MIKVLKTMAANIDDASPTVLLNPRLPSHLVGVIAESMVLFTLQRRLVDATVGFMASIYVFMFKYPTKLNNFCLFLQKCVFNISDGRRLPASVITLVNYIDKD
jgi:hypothetical protein